MQTNCFIMILYIHVSSCKMDIWSGTTYKMPIPRIIIEEQFVVHSTSPEFGDMTILLSIDWNDQEKFHKTVRKTKVKHRKSKIQKTNWLQPYKLLIQILLPGITQINRVDALLFYSLFYSKHIQPILSPFFRKLATPKTSDKIQYPSNLKNGFNVITKFIFITTIIYLKNG